MKNTPCRQCHFWIGVRDSYCPNCGCAHPATTQRTVDWYAAQQTIALLMACISLALAIAIVSTGATVARIALGGFILSGSGLFYGLMTLKTAQFAHISSASLCQNETVIAQRLSEIPARQHSLQNLLQSVVEDDPTTSEPLIATVNQAIATLHIQHRQYRLKLWEITVIRWSNPLQPLIDGWEQLSPEDCQRYLQRFSQIAARGAELLQEWYVIMNRSAGETSGHAPLQQALATVQKLRKALQARQIALTVQGISRFDDASGFLSTEEMLDELTIFNTLTDLRQFSSGFQALEDAYCRLKSEAELSS